VISENIERYNHFLLVSEWPSGVPEPFVSSALFPEVPPVLVVHFDLV
jgi:hypothetical protein